MGIFVTCMQIEIDGQTASLGLTTFLSFFITCGKKPEDIFRYFDTMIGTRTGRTVSHVRDRNNHAFRRHLKMADVAKNPFVSLSLCVASRKSARYMLYLWKLQFLQYQLQMITLYLVFWYKYYKILDKIIELSTHVKIGIFAFRIAYSGIGMVGGGEEGIESVRFINRVSVLSGSFLQSTLKFDRFDPS